MVRRLTRLEIRRRPYVVSWRLWRRLNVNIDEIELSAFIVGRRWDQFLDSLVVASDEFSWRPWSSAQTGRLRIGSVIR